MQAIAEGIVPAENVHSVGEEIKNPFRDQESPESEDIRFTVKDIKIQDTLPVDQFPRENYAQYEDEVALWVNEDTSLKPHERYVLDAGEWGTTDAMANKEAETVNSKYVVVKMQAENCSDFQTEWNASGGISIAPDLAYMKTNEDGSLSRADYQLVGANENYNLQWTAGNGASFPIYFDKIYYTEGVQRMKDAFFRPLAAGETLEYTLVYVADEDQLDSLYLDIYPGYGNTEEGVAAPYVKVK